MSEYKISACYFPGVAAGEITIERCGDGKRVSLNVPLTAKEGRELVDVIDPCVYYSADEYLAQRRKDFEAGREWDISQYFWEDFDSYIADEKKKRRELSEKSPNVSAKT